MSSLYAKYIKERLNFDTFEDSDGFISYELDGKDMYIRELYVLPEKRGIKKARFYYEIVKDLARKNNCSELISHVCINSNGWKKSKNILEHENFKYIGTAGSLLFYSLELEYGNVKIS